jgi:hypothetical protein
MNEEHDREAAALPCWVGLMVGSLALMTAHAAPEPAAKADADTQRKLIARKLVSNLFFLQHHPVAPPGLRQVAANLHAAWLPLSQRAEPRHEPADRAGAATPAAAFTRVAEASPRQIESAGAAPGRASAWVH